MINIRKEFPDVAFQNPASSGVILADFPSERAKSINRSVRAFFKPARIRIGDKRFFKKRVKNPVNGVMKKAIADAGFMNISRFGIIDLERLITAVLVGMISEVAVK